MAYELKLADVGEGLTEGEIVKWHVKVGDSIEKDQTVVSVETDKAVVEIPSPVAGKIQKLFAEVGQTVKVGSTLASIAVSGEVSESIKVSDRPAKPQQGVAVVGTLEVSDRVLPAERDLSAGNKQKDEILATPAVRKLAKELNVDISTVRGTGPGKRITEDDVKLAAHSSTETEEEPQIKESGVKVTRKYDLYGYVERIPLRGIRKATARHMGEANSKVAAVTHMDEADVTALSEIREREKVNAEKRGIKLTYMPFVIKAVIAALKDHPTLNAVLDEDSQEIIMKKYYNLGVAVDIEDGLVVPVVKGADKKSILGIAEEMQHLVDSARTRKLDIADMQGGTFTITNVGSLGGIFATPIVNYPEAAILALGKIYDKPRVINGQIAIRKVMPLSLTFDHRILDGAEAARFTNDLIKHLEDPELLLIEIGISE